MAGSVSRHLPQLQQFGRLWWLPWGGEGNGLDDVGWAPIAVVHATLVKPLLAAFGAASVPAYAAPATPRTRAARRAAGARRDWQIYAGTSAYSRAEETLLTVLPTLLARERGAQG
jgi:hypothetical protein